MHELLFHRQKALDDDDLLRYGVYREFVEKPEVGTRDESERRLPRCMEGDSGTATTASHKCRRQVEPIARREVPARRRGCRAKGVRRPMECGDGAELHRKLP